MQTSKETGLDLVSLKQAKKLKELGFDWGTLLMYQEMSDNDIKKPLLLSSRTGNTYNNEKNWMWCAPSITLALKWFWKMKGIVYSTTYYRKDETSDDIVFSYEYYDPKKGEGRRCEKYYSTPEKAESGLLDALVKCVEKLKKKSHNN